MPNSGGVQSVEALFLLLLVFVASFAAFKSIFDEAIEQEFLVKDPTRKLKSPKNLRPKDKQILTWEQLRAVLAKATRRDRILLMLDMTDALRPSELFAIRWRTFDDENTLDLTETVYRGEIRAYGKTPRVSARCIFRMTSPPSSGCGSWSAKQVVDRPKAF